MANRTVRSSQNLTLTQPPNLLPRHMIPWFWATKGYSRSRTIISRLGILERFPKSMLFLEATLVSEDCCPRPWFVDALPKVYVDVQTPITVRNCIDAHGPCYHCKPRRWPCSVQAPETVLTVVGNIATKANVWIHNCFAAGVSVDAHGLCYHWKPGKYLWSMLHPEAL